MSSEQQQGRYCFLSDENPTDPDLIATVHDGNEFVLDPDAVAHAGSDDDEELTIPETPIARRSSAPPPPPPVVEALKALVEDVHLVLMHRWGIQSSWDRSAIVNCVHVRVRSLGCRRVFDMLSAQTRSRDEFLELVVITLSEHTRHEDRRRGTYPR